MPSAKIVLKAKAPAILTIDVSLNGKFESIHIRQRMAGIADLLYQPRCR
ncbi:MAG: hypothetical protein R3C26_24210 [Calditrichia bacterium]